MLNTARFCSLLVLIAAVTVTPAAETPSAASPFFFVQLTDPQFGMYASDANLDQETANFEFAIATCNRLKPAFVIVTGDLLNKAGDEAQAREYLRIAAKLDRSIPIHHVPGNHDVGNEPTPESIAAYRARFGANYYSFRHGNMAALVLDSNLVRASRRAPRLAEQQEAWLKAELEKANKDAARPIVVFQHHSLFLNKADEPENYFNLPPGPRARCLDLLREHGVHWVFAGHYHGNQIARDGALEMVTTGPIGKPLRKDPSGLRVVLVRGETLEHRYYGMGEVPNRIDLNPRR